MNLSKHMTLKEFEHSPTATRNGYNNSMNAEQINSARELCEKIFEPVREFRGSSIVASSGFRGVKLNKAVKGSSSSQHCKGQALDLPLTTEEGLFIKDNLDFDQLIFEFPVNGSPNWVHVSYDRFKSKQRNQVLIAIKEYGRTRYIPYNGNENLIY